MRAPSTAAALLVALVAMVVGAPRAAADSYTLPQMVSRPSTTAQPNGPVQQVAVSSNGQYILYDLNATNMSNPPLPDGTQASGGLYRYDVATGQTDLAAYGSGAPENAAISDNGQYVLFSSYQLLPDSPSLSADRVWMRNMNEPADQATSYTEPIGDVPATTVGEHGMSTDGSTFLWISQSGSTTGTYPQNVTYWTDTKTGQTLPVSVAWDAATGTMNPNQPETDAINTYFLTGTSMPPYENAVLSGDGSTVAWYSNTVFQDTGQAPGDASYQINGGTNDDTAGVVWRDMAEGPRSVTRRVTSAADLGNPNCTVATPMTSELTSGGQPTTSPPTACNNPYLDTGAISPYDNYGGMTGYSVSGGPQIALSDDGTKVAVTADGHAWGSQITPIPDLYVISMLPGQDPVDHITPITQALPGGLDPPDTNAPIIGVGMSGNGRYVAFATGRIEFPPDPPTQVGTFPPYVGTTQLYLVDLQDMQMQLLSQTASGAVQDSGPVLGSVPGLGVSNPVVSDDGSTVAFMSSADNLVAGDANGFTDAFMVQQLPAEANTNETGPQVDQLPPTAPDLSPQPDWSLLVDNTTSEKNGDVTLAVEPPAEGVLRATVEDHGMQLAGASATGGPGPLTLTLAPQVTAAQGDPAVKRTRSDNAVVTFTPAPGGNRPISDTVPVSFQLPAEKIGASVRPVPKQRRLRLKLTLPSAGRVTVAATRRVRQAHGVRTARVANVSKRAGRAGTVVITLAPSGKLPTGRVPLRLNVRFAPAKAGIVPPLARTLAAMLGPSRRNP